MFQIKDYGDGGEFSFENNEIVLAKSLESQIYLCLFGGNVDNSDPWFGNLYNPTDEARQFDTNVEQALDQFIVTNEGFAKLEQVFKEALHKLVRLKLVESFDVKIERLKVGNININITAYITDKKLEYKLEYDRINKRHIFGAR